MSPEEAAWVGAMIEAEGSIRYVSAHRGAWRIGVQSTDVETLATLLRLTGAGRIRMHNCYVPTAAKKQQWAWDVSRKYDIRNLLYQTYRYMTSKRERAGQAVRWAVAQ